MRARQHDTLPVALYPPGCLFRQWAADALDRAGRPWRLAFVSRTLAAVESIAAEGLAITVVKAGTLPPRLRALGAATACRRCPWRTSASTARAACHARRHCSPIICSVAFRNRPPYVDLKRCCTAGLAGLQGDRQNRDGRDVNISLYDLSVWVLPLVLAITFHEAAHGFVAHRLGDNTAWQLGRVSFNPLRHIDPFGTLILPAMLLFAHSPFLFGYAKPVPVNFRKLNNPRLDMVWVALAGPVTNILLALAAGLALHALPLAPASSAQWIFDNLKNALLINAVLAVFNMMPIPPLDGGRVAVGLLPRPLALPLARLEPFGMLILIGLLILLPLVGSQFGLNLDVISAILRTLTGYVIQAVLFLTGNA